MTTAYWCVLAAGLMPYLFTAIAKGAGSRYDNRDPRAWQSRLAGLPARAGQHRTLTIILWSKATRAC